MQRRKTAQDKHRAENLGVHLPDPFEPVLKDV